MKPFTCLRCGAITLYPIETFNARDVSDMFKRFGRIHEELETSYQPQFDAEGKRTKWGFYARLNGKLAGLSLLGLSEDVKKQGYTGADTLRHMRGKGMAPGSKPILFYLGFKMLGLERIITGCHVSNDASKRSIEKTPGFLFEGIVKSKTKNDAGEFEDELRYAISRKDWQRLYKKVKVEVLV